MPLSPNGFPVLLSFDIDAETMWTGRDPKNAERPIVMSQGAYGWKVGMPRILDLLAPLRPEGDLLRPGPRHGAAARDGRGDPEARPRDRPSLVVPRLDRQPDARAGA